MTKQVFFKRLDIRARAPRYATQGAACFDLACLEGTEIPPTFSGALRTGLAIEVPPEHVMLVFSRSGHGFKNGVRLSNCVGVIDSDYRGEIAVKLHNDGDELFVVEDGDRIAQGLIVHAKQVAFNEAAELSPTARGEDGFGSTGNR